MDEQTLNTKRLKISKYLLIRNFSVRLFLKKKDAREEEPVFSGLSELKKFEP